MTRTPKKAAANRTLQPRVKVWLELDGEYAFGAGISRILTAVAEAGSIKGAAKAQGKSYRYVWSRIKEAEQTLGQTLVESQLGGQTANRSRLTARAVQLVRDYDSLRQRVRDLVEAEFATRFRNQP